MVQIIIWTVIGAVAVGALIALGAGSGGGPTMLPGQAKPILDETVPASGITHVELDLKSMDVTVWVTDEEDIRVVQLSSGEPDAVMLETSGGTLLVQQEDRYEFWGLFRFWTYEKLELYLPQSYAQTLVLKTKSGNITLMGQLDVADASFNLLSGNLKSDYPIRAGNRIDIGVTSGNIRLDVLESSAYNIVSTSGDIVIASLSGTGYVGATSGNMTIDKLSGARHEVKAFSGNIRIGGFAGYGTVHATSGNITMDCEAVSGDMDISAFSGDIRLLLPQALQFRLTANCTSGDIESNFAMSYSKNGKSATATVGENPGAEILVGTTSGNIRVEQKQG